MWLSLSQEALLISNGFFELRFPHLLIDGTAPKGFLGGKGYTDEPYRYKDKEYKYSVTPGKSLFINILLVGNSQTRDLINALKLIEESTNIDFRFSYGDSIMKSSDFNGLSEKANIIVIQGDYQSLANSSKVKMPIELSKYRSKIILYNNRERFVYNINPALFVKGRERFNLAVRRHDKNDCRPDDTFLLRGHYGVPFINSQCAYNYPFGMKLLADNQGRILTFDGEHLSEAGAMYLAKVLLNNKYFLNHIRSCAVRHQT